MAFNTWLLEYLKFVCFIVFSLFLQPPRRGPWRCGRVGSWRFGDPDRLSPAVAATKIEKRGK